MIVKVAPALPDNKIAAPSKPKNCNDIVLPAVNGTIIVLLN